MGATFVMAILVASNQTASAQQAIKIGYFDLEAMISLMPGAEKIDSILQAFSRDSINAEYQFRV
jgi:Skp family chaperone for outer membrane proteins